jgi:hypothetical protein
MDIIHLLPFEISNYIYSFVGTHPIAVLFNEKKSYFLYIEYFFNLRPFDIPTSPPLPILPKHFYYKISKNKFVGIYYSHHYIPIHSKVFNKISCNLMWEITGNSVFFLINNN